MRILLTAHGSRGDVYPMIALGQEFISCGHEVSIFTQANYREKVTDAGLKGIFTAEDMKESMASMGSNWKGVRQMMDWSRKSLEEEFEMLEDISGKVDLIVSTNQEFSVASMAEWRDIPAFRLSYIPAIPGDHTPPLIPWQNLPVFLNRMIWKGLGAGLDSMSKKTVNSWRVEHGLAAVKSLTPHMTSVYLTLYSFSSELAPPHPGWDTETYSYCGYCFEDDEEEHLSSDLQEFLSAGKPPIYFGFGSVSVPDPDGLTRMVLEAAGEADCRLIIARGWTGLGDEKVLAEKPLLGRPEKVFVCDEVSHSRLFPSLAGVCHHGGAGTTHRAARAGVPQFIMPVFVDQHFWGDRIHRSGAGPRAKAPGKLDVDSLVEIFREMISGMAWREGVTRVAKAVSQEEGTREACRIITGRMKNRESGVA